LFGLLVFLTFTRARAGVRKKESILFTPLFSAALAAESFRLAD
jgi:hypothetical protein